MKNLFSKLMAVAVFAVAGLMAGCSSAQKSEDVPPAYDVVQTTESAPYEAEADLGATSSGRGL